MASDLDRIVPLRDTGSKPPLFCVHAVSGSAYSYTGLTQLLGPEQPVYGFEAPGFDDDRTPVRSLPALSEEYVDTLLEFQPEGPYRLLGWSMGGVIAFDMAQRLAARGKPVDSLVLVDTGLPWVAELPVEKEIQRRFMLDIMGIAGESASGLTEIFAALPDDAEPEDTFAAVEEAGILPEELDADLLGDRYAVFRAHIEGLFAVEVKEPYAGKVTHILASESLPEYMRWDRVATDLVEHTVPGTHHSIWTGDSLAALGKFVGQALDSQGADR